MKKVKYWRRCFTLIFAFIFALSSSSLLLSITQINSASKVILKGKNWLQGYGVDVLTGKQCVELPQIRLYPSLDWPTVWAKVKAGTKYNGGAAYIPEGSPGLIRYNSGSDYVPVPGDLIIENPTSKNKYGHVAVVDYYADNIIYAVEQNASATGIHLYTYNNSNYAGGYGTIKAILHAPQNTFTNEGLAATFGSVKSIKQNIYVTTGKNKKIEFAVTGNENGYGSVKLKKTSSSSAAKARISGLPTSKFTYFYKKTTVNFKAKKTGKVKVKIALPNDKEKEVTIHIRKKPVYLKKIKKITGKSELTVGDKAFYSYSLSPASVTNLKVKWFTKGNKIKVNSAGLVKAVKKGATYLYLTIEGKTKRFKITVK